MITKEYMVYSPQGLHARPAVALIKLAKKYKAVIHINKNEKRIVLQSMLTLLTMAIQHGDTLSLHIDGEDEIEAGEELDMFFNEHLRNL
ncbi:MAG: HPr family phosphocarrier protein [Daejeonella sp.]|nr:HPr family phosphocarrier protein [Daejeonella sp.]